MSTTSDIEATFETDQADTGTASRPARAKPRKRGARADAATASVAAGLALLAATAAIVAAARALFAGPEAPAADVAVCAAPVEVARDGEAATLGCGSTGELRPCMRVAPGDRVILSAGQCRVQRSGMSAAMRLVAGLPLDLNRAGRVDLELLDGIGPRLAERILEYRERNGPFGSVDEIVEVRGIGPATLKRLRPLVEAR